MDRKFINEKDFEVLKFAVNSAKDANRITDKDFEELRDLGFSDDQLLEIMEAIANAFYQANFADSLANRLTWLQEAAGKYK